MMNKPPILSNPVIWDGKMFLIHVFFSIIYIMI
jgi:hypothetical protein